MYSVLSSFSRTDMQPLLFTPRSRADARRLCAEERAEGFTMARVVKLVSEKGKSFDLPMQQTTKGSMR